MIYVIGSMRHNRPREVARLLREQGYDVFDDWQAGAPDADDRWQHYESERGRTYLQALGAPFAQQAFQFDKRYLDSASIGVLVMPAGKSAHLELGYVIGKGKRGFILLENENPERWDIMYNFARVVADIPSLFEELKQCYFQSVQIDTN